MKFFNFLLIAIWFAVTLSCTLDKTDFDAETNRDVTEYFEFREVASLNQGNYKISIEALNGTLYKGYNEVRIKVINTRTNQMLNGSQVTLLPILTDSHKNKTSCPHKVSVGL